jgi:putative phosphoesterase
MQVAVLADIHANARALKKALKIVDNEGCDKIIILGDLLTYGVDIDETIELIYSRFMNETAILLRGNHDALYRDLLDNKMVYYKSLPTWIKESVDWTICRLPLDLWSKLAFKDQFIISRILFSHANPFGFENWQYLNTTVEHATAVAELKARELGVGVFGHTHRAKWYRCAQIHSGFKLEQFGALDSLGTHILNAGSIGQTRDFSKSVASVLFIDIPNNVKLAPCFKRIFFSWDAIGHMNGLKKSNMSDTTVARLVSFFTNQINAS